MREKGPGGERVVGLLLHLIDFALSSYPNAKFALSSSYFRPELELKRSKLDGRDRTHMGLIRGDERLRERREDNAKATRKVKWGKESHVPYPLNERGYQTKYCKYFNYFLSHKLE